MKATSVPLDETPGITPVSRYSFVIRGIAIVSSSLAKTSGLMAQLVDPESRRAMCLDPSSNMMGRKGLSSIRDTSASDIFGLSRGSCFFFRGTVTGS